MNYCYDNQFAEVVAVLEKINDCLQDIAKFYTTMNERYKNLNELTKAQGMNGYTHDWTYTSSNTPFNETPSA